LVPTTAQAAAVPNIPAPGSAVNTLTRLRPLTAECDYLRLHRDPHEDLVDAINHVIDAPHRPPIRVEHTPPHQTTIIPGRLQRFDNFAGDARCIYRYESKMGTPLIVHVPYSLCDGETEQLIRELADLLERRELAEL
jgi:hypothetical protein